MGDLPDVLDVGHQRTAPGCFAFGTDRLEGVCWRCREAKTAEPMQTCTACRQELAA